MGAINTRLKNRLEYLKESAEKYYKGDKDWRELNDWSKYSNPVLAKHTPTDTKEDYLCNSEDLLPGRVVEFSGNRGFKRWWCDYNDQDSVVAVVLRIRHKKNTYFLPCIQHDYNGDYPAYYVRKCISKEDEHGVRIDANRWAQSFADECRQEDLKWILEQKTDELKYDYKTLTEKCLQVLKEFKELKRKAIVLPTAICKTLQADLQRNLAERSRIEHDIAKFTKDPWLLVEN